MLCAHLVDVVGIGRAFVAQGDAHVRDELGEHHRSDAHATDGLFGRVHLEDGAGHVGLHLHLRAFVGVIAEVFGHAIAAAEEQAVEILGLELLNREDLASGQTRGLSEDVALFFRLFLGQVVDGLALRTVGGEALVFTMVLLDGEQQGDGLVDFAAVLAAAAGQDYCKFLHSKCFSVDFAANVVKKSLRDHANVNSRLPKKFQSVEAPTAKTLLR